MTIPRNANLRDANLFAQEREPWIRTYLESRPEQIRPGIGQEILWRGQEIPIRAGTGRAARMADGALHVPPDPGKQAIRIAAFLKNAAREELTKASDYYAVLLGCGFERISLRDPRSRWGSCSSNKSLMYSWRLIMAPTAVLEYVAAHEVAHLIEMNHSAAYWRLVEHAYPDHRAARQWLRNNGSSLHRYIFKD